MLINLTKLELRITNIHKLLFFNDIHKTEVELQNLEELVIKKSDNQILLIIIKLKNKIKKKKNSKLNLNVLIYKF